jgi:hexosaminidase
MENIFEYILVTLALLSSCKEEIELNKDSDYAIIPQPESIIKGKCRFEITNSTTIRVFPLTEETKLAADFLSNLLANPTGYEFNITESDKVSSNCMTFLIDDSVKNEEGYVLYITPKHVLVKARTAAGLFYAVQSIRQMLPVEVEKAEILNDIKLSLPACKIEDAPRFVYRGMHLDVSRHFFPVEYIKRYIDMIALHKMNTFHWHLTDDQGWRIEIKKYPKLTEVGAFRAQTVKSFRTGEQPSDFNGKRYGGFYTQEDVRDIVSYAKSRFVTIIPEIEMPGHALAALASYPEYSCTGGPFKVAEKWGIFEDVYCAGNDSVFTFLEDVLSEVVDLFPGKYIHIGGDECPKVRWKKCPKCQKRIKERGLENELELQSYFITRIEKFLLSKGRNIIGWDEILGGGIAPNATIMSWRGEEGGIAASAQKHNVIMTPNLFTYYNYYQTDPKGEPQAAGRILSLEKAYSYDPMPKDISEEQKKYIIGTQGCLWTEFFPTAELMEYMVYPRMFAMSEVGWTLKEYKDFDNFVTRLEKNRNRYDMIGINYFKGDYYHNEEYIKFNIDS